MEWIRANSEWIFSGIGIAVLSILYKLFSKSNNDDNIKSNTNNNVNDNSQKITVNNYLNTSQNPTTDSSSIENFSEGSAKLQTRILFIDDNHTDYRMVSILKKSGWIHTKSVKDITDLDDPKVQEAQIIFVDINGVGLNLFEDQGLGLASALKKKYPNKKVIIYSSETTGDRFHRALREVDGCLYKDAEPYQFINLIETFFKR